MFNKLWVIRINDPKVSKPYTFETVHSIALSLFAEYCTTYGEANVQMYEFAPVAVIGYAPLRKKAAA